MADLLLTSAYALGLTALIAVPMALLFTVVIVWLPQRIASWPLWERFPSPLAREQIWLFFEIVFYGMLAIVIMVVAGLLLRLVVNWVHGMFVPIRELLL